jgi:hypothetical protein
VAAFWVAVWDALPPGPTSEMLHKDAVCWTKPLEQSAAYGAEYTQPLIRCIIN